MVEKLKTINVKELEILEFWDKDKTFEKSLKKTKDATPYIFYDGPPFATGLPHYGHLLASIEKDVIPRFWTMRGFNVRRVWGWDCHGLPIENIAEKDLKINSKDEIERMGVGKFNDFCRGKVMSYAEDWEKIIRRLGRWVDMKNCYKTMDNNYIESVWWAFKQLYEKELIYEGEKILMYCPRCETPLAKSEVAMEDAYQTIKSQTVVVKFKLKHKEAYALAWTTTPWSLPSNLALAVNPNLDYVYLEDVTDKNIYLLSKDQISGFFRSEEDYKILEELKGKDLENLEYEPLFSYFKDTLNAFKIILGDFVNNTEGTGLVHIAPAFGEDDYQVCRKYKIPTIQPVDSRGKFTEEIIDFKGRYIHEVNTDIIIFLKEQGKVISVKKIEHEYPFCHRCATPLIYRALPAVFVNIQKIKDRMIGLNKQTNWYPEFLRDGRMQHNLETAPDWNLSRNRYWAAPIPLWKSKSGKIKVIGSIEELKKYAVDLPNEMDLHKDSLDKIILKNESGEEMFRVPDVFDCWFESGSMPFAQFHYPFENKELFEKNYPANFIAEGLDQTRGWFYSLIVLGTALFDSIPFKNVLVNGLILAEDGKKMSKKLKNYADPLILMEKYGVDTLRFYLVSSSVMNADNFNFSEKGVEEVYKKVIVLLHNVINFNNIYDNIPIDTSTNSKNFLDQWIISRLNELIKEVQEDYEKYNTIYASEKIKIFIEDLSTWFVRRSRDRFNENDSHAKTTLNFVLENLAKVISPIIPFSAEMIFKSLGKKESIHLSDWPKFSANEINLNLQSNMKQVREIVSLALRERDLAKLPLKQPLSEISIFLENPEDLRKYSEIIAEELNIKKVNFKLHTSNESNIVIKLDTKITSGLEDEGIARELLRTIQSMRKKHNLIKEDKIILNLHLEYKRNEEVFKFLKLEQNKIGAKIISFEKTSSLDFNEDGKIKDKPFVISFSKA
jgi:isoleucyl-tRNA synthetase